MIGDLISENLVFPPSRDDICKQFSLTEYELINSFKITFGMTMGRYLRQKRMQQAAKLLLMDNETIATIAGKVGFRNPSRFAESFRSEYGVNPFHFRKDRKKK